MAQPAATLPATLTLGEAIEKAQEIGKGAYPVINEDGKMVGLCTRTDFYRALQQFKPPTTLLAEVMKTPVLTVKASDNLTTALLLFVREPIKRLVVVEDDDASLPIGMLTPFDILKVLGTRNRGWATSTSSSVPAR